jgi:hypothetical protein
VKRKLISATSLAALAGLLALGVALGSAGTQAHASPQPQANEQSLCPGNCSEATIKGCYAIELEGWQGTGPSRVPFTLVGFYSADGKGNLSGEGTISVDGVITPGVVVTATYVVDPNTCTGTAVSNIGTFSFAIADGGKIISSISTTPGLTVHGVARRQFGS